MLHAWKRRKVCIGIRWGYVKERGHLEDIGIDSRTMLRLIFKEKVEEAWTGLVWLKKTNGWIL
jgi:hypothetical protein